MYESLMAQEGGYHGANNVQSQETEKFYNAPPRNESKYPRKIQTNGDPGHCTDSMAGMLAPPWNAIMPIDCIVPQLEMKGSVTQ
jgi:hypothetical protein